ncbi:MAG TPA: amidohydrolase family protein [Chloroflexota bacterium]|jgi:predicted TIM-barrel fold metal-dependent hydrolase
MIDVHCHYYPEPYTDLITRLIGRNQPRFGYPTTDASDHIAARLELMDQADVQRQVLCPSSSYPYFPNEGDAVEAARLCNDSFAELTHRYPERFAAYVSLPLPHIDASLRELERGLDQLGMVGATMALAVLDCSTAEVEFEPIYAELNRRAAVLFYHPAFTGLRAPFINDYKLGTAAGASIEDSVMVLHLIVRAVPFRFPDVKYVIPHLGGLTPMQLQRLDNQLPSQHPNLPEKPSETAKRLYYDTVGHGSQPALHCAWQAFGPGHLVTGSDYPFLMDYESYSETFAYIARSDLPPDDVEHIMHRSAAELFGSSLVSP